MMSLLRGWGVAGLLVAAALWLAPGQARAFPDEPYSLDEGNKAHTQRFHILGEVAVFGGKLEGDERSIVVSPLIEMRLQLAYSFIMQVLWGMSYVNLDVEDGDPQNAFRSGNPYVAFHYQGKKNQFSYRAGLGVTIPVATITSDLNDQNVQQSAYTLAAAVRGNTSSKTDFIMQMVGMMGYQATDWLRVGSRFSLVLIPKFRPANTQLAVEPYLRFGNDNAFGAIRLNINLDNPYGFSFDDRQVWGLRIGGGAAF